MDGPTLLVLNHLSRKWKITGKESNEKLGKQTKEGKSSDNGNEGDEK